MATPFVQRGFELPVAGYGSFLADIPEQQHSETGGQSSSSMHQSQSAPDAFIVPHFRSWNGGSGNGNGGASPVMDHQQQQQQQGFSSETHGANSADDLTDVLRNFINLDGNANSQLSGNNNPSSTSPKGLQTQSVYDFHGYRQLQSASAFYNAFQQLPPHLQQLSPNATQSSSLPSRSPVDVPNSPAPLLTNIALDARRNDQTGTSNPASIFAGNQGDNPNGHTHSKAYSSAFSPASFNNVPLPSPSIISNPIMEEAQDADSRGPSRPNSHNETRGRRTSPSDDKSRGRNSSAGRAPPQRPSRSRTRKPSYSRTISPGQTSLRNSTGPTGISLAGTSVTPEGLAGGSGGSTTVTSPYMPGYPPATSQHSRFASSVPTHLNGSAGSLPQSWHGNGYPFAAFPHRRRPSDASTFAPSSFGADGSPHIATTGLPQPEAIHNAVGMDNLATSLPVSIGAPSVSTPIDEGGDAEEARGRTAKGPDDKRKKRRESHNAVERRRRDNINERITELANLIPEILLDPATAAAGGSGDRDEVSPTGIPGEPNMLAGIATFSAAQLAQQQASNRPNKGVILTKSVEYIRYLQQLVRVQAERNRDLEQRISQYEGNSRASSAVQQNRSAGSGDSLPRSSSSGSPNSLLGHAQQLPTVEERLMEENQMSFEDLLGFGHASPAKVEDYEDMMS